MVDAIRDKRCIDYPSFFGLYWTNYHDFVDDTVPFNYQVASKLSVQNGDLYLVSEGHKNSNDCSSKLFYQHE